jgi:hypothetical protein
MCHSFPECAVSGRTFSGDAADERPVPRRLALRGVEERPFEAGVTAGMGRVVREIDGMRGDEEG